MISTFRNTFRKLLAGILPVLILASCSSDDLYPPVGGKTKGESAVTFSIQVPGTSTPSPLRAISQSNENDVNEVDILVFDPTTGDYVYRTGCSGSAITGSGTNNRLKTFTVNMRQGSFNVVILTNVRDKIAGLTLDGLDKDAILAQLEAAMPAGGKWPTNPYTPFPMWGDAGTVTINDNTNLTGIKLTRMVARVDVKIADAVTNFKLTGVNVYNYNTRGSVVPNTADWDTTTDPNAPRATKPNVPTSSTLTKGPLTYGDDIITPDGLLCEREIYIFEAENHSDGAHTEAKGLTNRTCLVIKGVWDANGDGDFTNDGPATYYRVDFSQGNGASQQYLDVLRNHRYIFSINKVSGPGHEDSQTAFESGPVNIETEVLEWNEVNMGNIAFDGQFVLSVSRDEFTFFRDECTEEGDDNVLYVFTDYDTDTQSGWHIDKIESATDGVDKDWLTLTPQTGDADEKTKIVMTYDANDTGADRTVIVWFAAGRLRYPVTVTQTIIPHISLDIVDPVTNEPLTELVFDAGVGQIPATQSFKVVWTPLSADVTVSNTPLAANPFPSGSGAPESGVLSGGTGPITYDVQPAAVDPVEAANTPFLDKTSKVDFTVSNGITYASVSIMLRQIVYSFIATPESSYLLNGSTYTLPVRCNTSWQIKEINEYPSETGKTFFALKPGDNLRVGGSGGYNVSGEPVTFTVVNDRTFSGHVDVVFENTENKFEEVTVTLIFPIPKMKIVGIAPYETFGYNVALTHPLNGGISANTFLSSPNNFGITSESTVQSAGFEFKDFRYNTAVTEAQLNELRSYINTDKPEIIVLGYDLYISPVLADLFLEYLEKGGVLLALNEGNANSVQSLMQKVFGDSNIGQTRINVPGAVYKLPTPDSNNADDLVLNGPFGDLRGKQWGDDTSQSCMVTNFSNHLDKVIVYSNGQDISSTPYPTATEPVALRHKELGLIWIGDGGFVSSYKQNTSSISCPFLIDDEKRPIPRSGFGNAAGTKYDVYNSQMFGNMIYWAMLYSLEHNSQ